jgi:hypothetical protein
MKKQEQDRDRDRDRQKHAPQMSQHLDRGHQPGMQMGDQLGQPGKGAKHSPQQMGQQAGKMQPNQHRNFRHQQR